MKKVLLLTLEYPPDRGGVATYLASLHADLSNCTVLRASSWKIWPQWLPAFWKTFQIVRSKKIELIAVSHVLPMGYVALKLKLLCKTPYVVFVHGLDVMRAYKNPWKRWWATRILQGANTVVANSEFTRGIISRFGIPREKSTVILPCVPEMKSEERNTVRESHTLLSVGRLVTRKNHTLVLQALPKLITEFSKLQYVILGDGPLRETLEIEAVRLGVRDAVTFIPQADDATRTEWYARATVFVLPTRSLDDDVEGLGIVFLEAAQAGLPIVAGRGGGVSEAVCDGETGFLINPSSVDELIIAIRKLLNNSELAARMGEGGHKWVNQEFRASDRRLQIETLYK